MTEPQAQSAAPVSQIGADAGGRAPQSAQGPSQVLPARSSYRRLMLFMAIVFAVAVIGRYFSPGEWYAALWKPPWTPPNWLFGPVWTVLYLMIAIAGWKLYSVPDTAAARLLWAAQLVLNALWSWLFFGLHAPWAALADILALAACIAALMAASYRRVRPAFWLLLPYLVWVTYAVTLNAAIAYRNPA